jgi:hypothetical protein
MEIAVFRSMPMVAIPSLTNMILFFSSIRTSMKSIPSILLYSLNIKSSRGKMKLSWKDVHLSNEIIYNGNLSRLREYNWDFSHLDVIIETLLNQRPDHDVYLYGSVESAEDYSRLSANNAVQAPIIVAISLPTGRVPTHTMGYYRNQTVVERINSFNHLKL